MPSPDPAPGRALALLSAALFIAVWLLGLLLVCLPLWALGIVLSVSGEILVTCANIIKRRLEMWGNQLERAAR